MEFIRDISGESARFGIATVQPNRAIRKCKIRNLRVEYFLSDSAVVLITPKSCGNCQETDECTDDFILQIIEKYNDNHKGLDLY